MSGTKEELKKCIETLRSLSDECGVKALLPENDDALIESMELLPDTISEGRIIKITLYDFLGKEDDENLGRDGTSAGLLYVLDDGACVKRHLHDKNMETYVSIEKPLVMEEYNRPKVKEKSLEKYNDENIELGYNICQIYREHELGPLPKGTIIGTFKVDKDKILEYFKPREKQSEIDV